MVLVRSAYCWECYNIFKLINLKWISFNKSFFLHDIKKGMDFALVSLRKGWSQFAYFKAWALSKNYDTISFSSHLNAKTKKTSTRKQGCTGGTHLSVPDSRNLRMIENIKN